MGNFQSRGMKRKQGEDGDDGDVLDPKVQRDLTPAPITTMDYNAEMWGEEMDYKNRVVHMLSTDKDRNLLMFELRMMLFVAASVVEKREIRLVPFPSCFFDRVTRTKDFTGLCEHLDEIPSALALQDPKTELKPKTWELLYWIFTNPLTLEPVPLTSDLYFKISEMKHETGLKYLPIPDNSNVYLFKITQTQPNPKFDLAKEKYGSLYAFHGSPLYNFHSIIHRGFLRALNIRDAFGSGTYSSPKIEISEMHLYSPPCRAWVHSTIGHAIKSIAICEIINTNITIEEDFCYVCKNDEHMRLTHIYIYSTRVMDEDKFIFTYGKKL